MAAGLHAHGVSDQGSADCNAYLGIVMLTSIAHQ